MANSNQYEPPRSNPVAASSDFSSLPIAGMLPPVARVGIFGALWALFVFWFFYDGWLNADPEMVQHQTFNRVMFVISALFAALLFRSIRRVARATQERVSNPSAVVAVSPENTEIRIATMPWLWAIVFSGLSLLIHKRPSLGVLCFVGSFFSANLVGLGLAFFIRKAIESGYVDKGWTIL